MNASDTITHAKGALTEALTAELTEKEWITPAKAEAAWRERNIALCRLFLTTTMNVNEVAGIFGIAPTTVRLVLFKFGIPSKRRHALRPEWERQQGYGRRRDQLPPDLQALIENMPAQK